jgi:ADP-heptose:LPS heptosyltransferase/GT2 family glycosyltransferase
MSLTIYSLPCGKIYVNRTPIDQAFYDKGQLVKLKPNQVYFSGARQLDLLHYLISPTFWESSERFQKLLRKEGEVGILLDIHQVSRYGDNLMFTILPKGYTQFHPKNVIVDVWVDPRMAVVWDGNPWVRDVVVDEAKLKSSYEMVVDLNRIELRFKNTRRCSDVILETAGLQMVNRTPVYVVSPEERSWAKKTLAGRKRPLAGVAAYSYAQIRTWPYMRELVKQLHNHFGYSVVVLDERDEQSRWKLTFRQMAALMEQCDLVVANDSAALHLAGALKKRVLGIFGHTDGVRIAEDYEKAVVVNAPSSACKNAPCWWAVPCLGEGDYHSKESQGPMECLTKLSPDLVIETLQTGLSKVRKVLAVMLTYNMLEWTKLALDSIRTFHDCDVFVVDNESSDGTQEWLASQGIEFTSKRQGVAAAQNVGLEKFYSGDYDYLLLLNNDIALRYDTIDKLVDILERDPKVSVVTAQEVLDIPPWLIDSISPRGTSSQEIIDIPPSAYSCTMFRRDILEKVGRFDEHFTPRYIEDNDYQLRIRLAGGKFIKTQEAIYYHILGGVLSTNEAERREKDVHWIKNISYYQEKWGIHPHEHQDLDKLGEETRVGRLARFLDSSSKDVSISIRRNMGGWGDVIFTTVLAREIKNHYGTRVKVFYDVPEKYRGLLGRYPYIDGVVVSSPDFTLDLTDVEFRAEWQEISQYGGIQSARTDTYLRVAGLTSKNLRPDYFVKDEEREWAKTKWEALGPTGRKIFVVPEGSNPLKTWTRAKELYEQLRKLGYRVLLSVPEFDFYQASALISEAELVISPDTGLSNVAGALGVPVLTLFSNRNPEPFLKMFSTMLPITGTCPLEYVSGCDYKVPCAKTEGPYRPKEFNLGEPECFRSLTVEKVVGVVTELLS